MEIDKNLPNKSNNFSFKNEDINEVPPNVTLLDQKIKSSFNSESNKDVLQNSKELDSSKKKRKSYQIILRTSYDKAKSNNEKNKSGIDINQSNANNNQKENSCSQNENTLSINDSAKFNENNKKYNINANEDIDNKVNDNMEVEEENNNNMNNLKNKDKNQNKDMYENDEENNNGDKYYNAFNKMNKGRYKSPSKENIKLDNEEKKYISKKGKLPNITLTTFQPPIINNEEKEGNFSRFLKLFSTHKKEKLVEKRKEEKEEGTEDNKLMTLEEKLKDENIISEKNDIKNKENSISNKKDDYILNVKSPKKKEAEKNDIRKEDKKDEKEKEESDKELNNNINNYNFIIKAEPIFCNNNREDVNNNSNTENNICDSEEIRDDDKSSKYSFLSSKSIIELIRKNSKCSALLLAILFGSCGLFYLLYKKMNLKELLVKISEYSKLIPGFFSNIFSAILEDFMERYNDTYRLLIGIIIIIGLWFLIKIHFKAFMKRKKNN